MKEISRFNVPTGTIVVCEGDNGRLEFLSIGDYGKDVNLNKDTVVPDDLPLLPLTDKLVITISTQYGCSMGCQFCDVPKVGPGTNCTLNDLQQQVIHGLSVYPSVKYSNRLNIHYARMGEPSWNPSVLDHAKWMKEHIDPEYNVHPVLTSMMPAKNEWLKTFIHTWVRIKNRVYRGNAGLQLSINSTSENERLKIFSKNALPLHAIAKIMDGCIPVGRKFTLNFPVANWEVDPCVLSRYFDPSHWIVKLTPMHETATAKRFGHHTVGDYTNPEAYKEIADSCKREGFEVLVFIASRDEDEGMITCGNAVLASQKTQKVPRARIGPLSFMGGSEIGRTPFRSWSEQKDPYHVDLVESNISLDMREKGTT